MNSHNIPLDQLTLHRRPLDALTGIRFFAAIYVVLYHSNLPDFLTAHHLPILSNFIKNGFLAVSLFFLLSGFILSYTYTGRVHDASERRRFWEARVARLYPVYLLSLILTSAVHFSIPKLTYAVPALLMLQAWNPFDKGMWGAWNYVCWTLSVEAFFYVLFPAYQLLMERMTARWRVGITCLMIALGVALNSGVRVLGYPTEGVLGHIPLPLLRLPEFFAGIGLGMLFLYQDSKVKLEKRLILPGSGALTYISFAAVLLLLCRVVGPLTSLVLIPFAALIFCLASEVTFFARVLRYRWLVFGGSISYAIYLLQVAAKDFSIAIGPRLHIASVGLRFVGNFLILLLVSAVVYKMVEVPGREKIRAWFSALEKRRLSSATGMNVG